MLLTKEVTVYMPYMPSNIVSYYLGRPAHFWKAVLSPRRPPRTHQSSGTQEGVISARPSTPRHPMPEFASTEVDAAAISPSNERAAESLGSAESAAQGSVSHRVAPAVEQP
jgi:hypothetical protein